MLVTLAASARAAGGLDFEFAVAAEGRLSEELLDGGARVHALGNVRLSHPSSVVRARHQIRGLLRRYDYAAVGSVTVVVPLTNHTCPSGES